MSTKPGEDHGQSSQFLRVIIGRDGRVSFGQFTEEMLEVALALSPNDPRLRARTSKKVRTSPSRKRGTNEKDSG